MKILITGSSGFIGKNILESFLSRKHIVLAPSHEELELMDEEAVREFFEVNKVDVVIHAAAKPGHRAAKDPTGTFLANTRIFFNLARNAHLFEKMIVMGSGAAYDMRYYRPRMTEEYFDVHVPIDEHGLSKYVIQKYLENKRGIIDLRIFGIFGKYEEYSIRFISNIICKALFDMPLTMSQNCRFSYLYVGDLSRILDLFIEGNPKHESYNVTPSESYELYDIAKLVLKMSGKSLPIIVSKQGFGLEYTGDNSRLMKEFREISFTPLEQAVGELYEWYHENKTIIDKRLLLVDK